MTKYLFYNRQLLPEELQDYIDGFGDDVSLEKDDPFFINEFYTLKSNTLTIVVTWDDEDESDSFEINQEQIEDFIEFLNDPNLYKNVKKYNL